MTQVVVRGFLVEIIQQIGDTELQERLSAAIEAELLGADGQGTGGAQH